MAVTTVTVTVTSVTTITTVTTVTINYLSLTIKITFTTFTILNSHFYHDTSDDESTSRYVDTYLEDVILQSMERTADKQVTCSHNI